MQEFIAALKPINVEQLESEMRAAFEKKYHGLSTDQKSIRFFLDDDLSDEDKKSVEAIYEAHTPIETDDQAVERKRTAKKDLRQTLREFDKSKVRKYDDLLPYLEALISLAVDD